jgi:hypothetical protein
LGTCFADDSLSSRVLPKTPNYRNEVTFSGYYWGNGFVTQGLIERLHGRFRATLISLTYNALLSPCPDAFQKLTKTLLTPGSLIDTWNE